MPFEPKSAGTGDFVKLRDLEGTVFQIVSVRGPMPGRFSDEEYKVDILDEEGEEKTFSNSISKPPNGRDDWLRQAQQYLEEHPTEVIPTRVSPKETKGGQTFRALEPAYES